MQSSTRVVRFRCLPRRGFTLVELMVVLVIIGLLAGIVVVSIGGETDEAKQKTAQATAKSLYDAVEIYRTRAGDLPERLEQLIEGPPNWDVNVNGKWRPLLQSQGIPRDPWQGEYIYEITDPDIGAFTIKSLGKDKQPGGAGPARDIIFPRPRDDGGDGRGGF